MTQRHTETYISGARATAAQSIRGPLSVVLTLTTAFVAVLCIHLGSGGIQYMEASDERPRAAPTAALEFAPLTDAIELQPARAPTRNNAFF